MLACAYVSFYILATKVCRCSQKHSRIRHPLRHDGSVRSWRGSLNKDEQQAVHGVCISLSDDGQGNHSKTEAGLDHLQQLRPPRRLRGQIDERPDHVTASESHMGCALEIRGCSDEQITEEKDARGKRPLNGKEVEHMTGLSIQAAIWEGG